MWFGLWLDCCICVMKILWCMWGKNICWQNLKGAYKKKHVTNYLELCTQLNCYFCTEKSEWWLEISWCKLVVFSLLYVNLCRDLVKKVFPVAVYFCFPIIWLKMVFSLWTFCSLTCISLSLNSTQVRNTRDCSNL